MAWPVLKSDGVMISVRSDPLETRPPSVSANGIRVFVEPNGARLAEIAVMIDDGKITVPIDAVFPLSDAAAAHGRMRGRGRRGKIVLKVGEATST